MNKVVLCCSIATVLVLGGLFLTGNQYGTRVVPYYVPQNSPSQDHPKSIFIDPPSLEQIKKDLGGKTVVINGNDHQFVGPEINSMSVLSTRAVQDGVAVDLKICADITIVEKVGVFRNRYSHENVCGCVRLYYEKKGESWSFRMVENVDLEKVVTPNAVAPPSPSRVWRHYR